MAKTTSPALFPILEQEFQHPLGPLARRAAEAPLEAMGCLTEYRPLAARSILSKSTSKRGLPFTHAINPYRGCEFACRYCYARYTHEFLDMNNPEDFERKIYFKQNAGWLLTQDLKRLKPDTQIALGTATDPYQPLERKQGVTRSVLEVFAATSGFQLGIVTKSTLILRDLDLLKQITTRHKLTLHITITTMNTKLARILEPRAPRPDLRMQAVATLRQAGLRTGVMCSPLMPGITDSRGSITAVAKAASQARANFMAAGALFLKPCSRPTFMSFVREHFPEQVASYEQRYGANAFVSPEYRKRITDLVDAIRREYKLGVRYSDEASLLEAAIQRKSRVALQPWLPFA